MWFKNLFVYRLPADYSPSPADLEEQLSRRTLQPCGPLESITRGWVPVTPGGRLLHSVGQQHLLCLGSHERLLPASIIRQVTLEQAEVLAQEQGFPVGRRQLRDLRLKVTDELRAKSLVRRRATRAWLDSQNGWFVIDAAGAAAAEAVTQMLRETLGSFSVLPLESERSATALMTAWLQRDTPFKFSVDQDLELQTPDTNKATIRYVRHALDGKDIQAHLTAGKYVTRLGLTWNDRVSFVLTDKLQLKRIEFLEMKEENSQAEDLDPAEQFDIDFTVMTGELAALLRDLSSAIKDDAPDRNWQTSKVA